MRAVVAGLVILAAAARPAGAHPGLPVTVSIHLDPADHDVMGLSTSWGFLQTEDGGATWHWMCEEAIGFGGAFYPDYAYSGTGILLATTTSVRGLARTADHCTWEATMDPPIFIAQVEVGPDGTVLAAASTGDSTIYVSHDHGASFDVLSHPSDNVDQWESMVIGPVAARVYLAGYRVVGPLKERSLWRSDDGGAGWTELPTAAFAFTDAMLPELQIVAVSPTDPDLVFARVKHANGVGIGDDIYRSPDAGMTWTRVFASGDDVSALVVRASGQVVLAERLSGVHLSDDGGQTFGAALPDSPIVEHMRERDDGLLFVCGRSFIPDDMALGTSSDAVTWTPILTFAQVADAYPGCAAGTTQHDVCYQDRWCAVVCQFSIDDAACLPCNVFPPDAGPDPVTPPPPGCCSTAATPDGALALLVALVLARRCERGRARRGAGRGKVVG